MNAPIYPMMYFDIRHRGGIQWSNMIDQKYLKITKFKDIEINFCKLNHNTDIC